jgi:hypothetical protein
MPTAVSPLRSRRASPRSTACPAARRTLSQDVRKADATSLQFSCLARVARSQRWVVVRWLLPTHYGTISTVTPHRRQSTRRIR